MDVEEVPYYINKDLNEGGEGQEIVIDSSPGVVGSTK